VQRIFTCDKIQSNSLASDKVLNIVMWGRLCLSLYVRVTNFQKWSGFLGPPCTLSLLLVNTMAFSGLFSGDIWAILIFTVSGLLCAISSI